MLGVLIVRALVGCVFGALAMRLYLERSRRLRAERQLSRSREAAAATKALLEGRLATARKELVIREAMLASLERAGSRQSESFAAAMADLGFVQLVDGSFGWCGDEEEG